ncbi:MAG: SpoIIE family protein phosphatase [Pirellulales bacterium]|nr:SpoIIE family protein phosphatase [Pirellulales bacterium]
MVKAPTEHLKIFPERAPEVVRPEVEDVESLAQVLRDFRESTGWSLRYDTGLEPTPSESLTWSTPVNPGAGATPGHLSLHEVESGPGRVESMPVESAKKLAAGLGDMLAELLHIQHLLWQREAELAAGVPLICTNENEAHLAARLEAVLKGGAEAVGAHAAALYLLDEATSELKMRSCWGLPRRRLAEPARPLQGALADLEALLGHAVVLEDVRVMQYWNVPEDFASAVCIPVASPTMILGTLWVFCKRKRDFDDRQTNVLEMVAGRLAADLEREMLIREGVDGAILKRQVAAAERLQRGGLPSISPLLAGWDVAGWAAQAHNVGGNFFDWFSLPDGLLAATLGDAMDKGIEAALSAATAKSSLRSHAQYQRDPARLLQQVNLTLWTGSAGDQSANLFCGLIETANGQAHFASAGQLGVILIRPDGWESLSQPSQAAGQGPQVAYEPQHYELQPGEALVVFSDGVRDALDHKDEPLGEAGLGGPLAEKAHLPADELLALARDRLEAHAVSPQSSDRSILVVKRAAP